MLPDENLQSANWHGQDTGDLKCSLLPLRASALNASEANCLPTVSSETIYKGVVCRD
jgi:hypothetical protein